jgi:deoxyribose-phosphate aldolase
MVMDYVSFNAGDKSLHGMFLWVVKEDINAIVSVAHQNKGIVKLILETSELTPDGIKEACKLAADCGVDFVKTSTGFSKSGANERDLKIMRENFPRGVKMSGGVNKENVRGLLYAASGRDDGYIDLDPMRIRVGESSLLY